jgi:hypothetical protein
MSVCLSVCLPVCLSVCPAVRPSVRLSIRPSVHLPVPGTALEGPCLVLGPRLWPFVPTPLTQHVSPTGRCRQSGAGPRQVGGGSNLGRALQAVLRDPQPAQRGCCGAEPKCQRARPHALAAQFALTQLNLDVQAVDLGLGARV